MSAESGDLELGTWTLQSGQVVIIFLKPLPEAVGQFSMWWRRSSHAPLDATELAELDEILPVALRRARELTGIDDLDRLALVLGIATPGDFGA